MKKTAPHYLLITETKTIIDSRETGQTGPRRSGHWRFVLEQMGVEARIEVADEEPNVSGERLELLAVVRGLEALEQASQVTLLTSSRYVGRGVRQGMSQWKSNQWRWERFGKMTLIKNHDLWRRVDQALQFHTLDCRIWDLGRLTAHTEAASVSMAKDRPDESTRLRVDGAHRSVVRRPNVIRPHGDHSATARKPIEPQSFEAPRIKSQRSERQRLESQNLEPQRLELQSFGPRLDAGGLADPHQRNNSIKIVRRAIAGSAEPVSSNQRHQQRNLCVPKLETKALVKPPRAGRAYGYAVN